MSLNNNTQGDIKSVCMYYEGHRKEKKKKFGSPFSLSRPRPVTGVVCRGSRQRFPPPPPPHSLAVTVAVGGRAAPAAVIHFPRRFTFLCSVFIPQTWTWRCSCTRRSRFPSSPCLRSSCALPLLTTRRLLLFFRVAERGPTVNPQPGTQTIVTAKAVSGYQATESGSLCPPSWRLTLQLGAWTKSTCPLWGYVTFLHLSNTASCERNWRVCARVSPSLAPDGVPWIATGRMRMCCSQAATMCQTIHFIIFKQH